MNNLIIYKRKRQRILYDHMMRSFNELSCWTTCSLNQKNEVDTIYLYKGRKGIAKKLEWNSNYMLFVRVGRAAEWNKPSCSVTNAWSQHVNKTKSCPLAKNVSNVIYVEIFAKSLRNSVATKMAIYIKLFPAVQFWLRVHLSVAIKHDTVR